LSATHSVPNLLRVCGVRKTDQPSCPVFRPQRVIDCSTSKNSEAAETRCSDVKLQHRAPRQHNSTTIGNLYRPPPFLEARGTHPTESTTEGLDYRTSRGPLICAVLPLALALARPVQKMCAYSASVAGRPYPSTSPLATSQLSTSDGSLVILDPSSECATLPLRTRKRLPLGSSRGSCRQVPRSLPDRMAKYFVAISPPLKTTPPTDCYGRPPEELSSNIFVRRCRQTKS
jgi:hypothetical protein